MISLSIRQLFSRTLECNNIIDHSKTVYLHNLNPNIQRIKLLHVDKRYIVTFLCLHPRRTFRPV